MKRFALLIGSPSTKQSGNYLVGVKTDIENMYGFLRSSIGGNWQKDEIKYFYPNPNFEDVRPYLEDCEEMDLAFVYFSGHGGTDTRNNNSRVQFNSVDNPLVKHLAKRAKRQITIIDACRGYSEYYDAIGEGVGRIEFSNINQKKSRDLYNKYMSIIPEQSRVLFFASQHNQNALDAGINGGFFSTNLLKATKLLIDSENLPILSIEKVFSKTYDLMKNSHLPEILISQESAKNLPFAVKPNYEPGQINKTLLFEDFIKVALIGSAIVGGTYIISSILSGKK